MSVTDPPTTSAPRRLYRDRVLAGVGLAQVVTWQVTALAVAAAFGWAGPRGARPPYAVAVVAVLVAVVILWLTVTRRAHYWRWEWVVVRRRFRARTAAGASSTVNSAADLVTSLVPHLTPRTFVDRSGTRHGMLGEDDTWAVVLRLQPRDTAVVGTGSMAGVQPEVLAAALGSSDNRIASAQVVMMSAPDHRGPLAVDPDAAASAQLPRLARQACWLVLRLDPRRCPSAVRARGGGVEGAQRALASAAARASIRLADSGIDARVLDADSVQVALRRCLGLPDTARSGRPALVQGAPGPGADGALREHWEDLEAAGTTHATYWVRRWPRSREGNREGGTVSWFLSELAAAPAAATSVVSTTLTRARGTDVNVQTMVRFLVPVLNPPELNSQVLGIAKQWGASVVRLEGEQLPGAIATLPTGGPTGAGLLRRSR